MFLQILPFSRCRTVVFNSFYGNRLAERSYYWLPLGFLFCQDFVSTCDLGSDLESAPSLKQFCD